EILEQVQGVPPALEDHRDAEQQVDRPREVERPDQQHQRPRNEQTDERIPVSLEREDERADGEAQADQVERIAQPRVPVAHEDRRQDLLDAPSGPYGGSCPSPRAADRLAVAGEMGWCVRGHPELSFRAWMAFLLGSRLPKIPSRIMERILRARDVFRARGLPGRVPGPA